MIEKLINLLGDDLELTAEEIADVLWLAKQWHKRAEIKTPKPQMVIQSPPISKKEIIAIYLYCLIHSGLYQLAFKLLPRSSKRLSIPTDIISPPQPSDKIYGVYPFSETKTTPTKSIPFPVPDAPAIPQPLTFVKAFRPLMREIASLTQQVLNEEATVNQVAETELLLPILEPATEKWLQLDLVIDESSSSILWRRTIQELESVFRNYGIFRDVRKWNIGLDETNKPYLRSATRFRHLNELIDLQGRRLILIISDCVDPLWQKGYILPTLRAWANHNPVVLLQMLPSWLWSRTALGQGINAQLTRLGKPIANRNLQVYASSLWDAEQLETGIKLPLITFAPEKVEHWALMLAGGGEKLNLGYVLQEDLIVERLGQTNIDSSSARIKAFKQNSTPQARQLAELLAAAPVIIMPVVRLIQNTFLETPQPEQVMEVFLGGLLEPVIAITPESEPEKIQYQFKPGVREALVGTIEPKTVEKVIDRVSRYIANRLGKSLREFVALLKAPQASDEPELVGAFARVTETILKQTLGYQQSSSSDNGGGINGDLPELEFNVKTIEIDDLPEIGLETFEFVSDIALIVFEEITEKPLQQWEFETVMVNRRGKVINRQIQSNYYFKENLGDNIDLEMVAISGGTFIMGSPENEGYNNDEKPQHKVTVSDFFMGKYPITQAQWRAIASSSDLKVKIDLDPDPSEFKGDNRPVETINWYEAVEFCQRLSRLTGRDYRLPSEAEWEYACRAVIIDHSSIDSDDLTVEEWNQKYHNPFYFGDTLTGDLANYNASSTYADEPKGEESNETTPVGQFPPNANGLYDMHGNVWEWCADDWHSNYEGATTDGSAWLDNNETENINNENEPDSDQNEEKESYTVLRGGSWFSLPNYCRSASRDYDYARVNFGGNGGFRVVCVGRG